MKFIFSNPRCLAVLTALTFLSTPRLQGQSAGNDPWTIVGQFQFGQSREPLALIEEQIRKTAPDGYPALETRLLGILQAPDTQKDARRYLCRWLGIVGSAKSVPALATFLSDPDLSHPARIALEKLPTPVAGKALSDALPSLKGKLLIGVISSLGIRREREAAQALGGLVEDNDTQVAAAAMAALGQIGSEDASLILDRAKPPRELERPLANARIVAASRLAEAGEGPRASAIYRDLMATGRPAPVRIAALKGLVRALPQGEAVKLITEMLQGDDLPMRTATLSAYTGASDKALKEGVAQALPTLKPSAQVLLMGVLADEPDVAVRKPVLAVLQSATDPQARAAALECLARHGEAEDVPLLVGLAASKGGAEESAAKRTLQRLGKPGVNEALVRLIESPQANERAIVLETLAARHVDSALPTLVRLLQGSDSGLATEAAKALGVMGQPKQLSDLAKVLAGTADPGLRGATAEAIKGICRRAEDSAPCAAVLTAAVEQAQTSSARAALLPVLLNTGGQPALNQVVKSLKDEDVNLRSAAFRTLVSWPEADAGPYLLELAKTSENPNQAIVALRDGCLRLAETDEVPLARRLALLRGILEVAKRPEEKRRAVAALSALPSVGALDLLQGCLADAPLKPEAMTATIKLARSLGGVYTRQSLAALDRVKAQADTEQVQKEVADAIKAVQEAGKSPEGFILAWQLAGPYTQADKDGAALFDVAFAPEKPGAQTEWRPLTGPKTGVIDLGKMMPGENRVAYLQTAITTESEQAAILELGSDDGVKVWLNGQVVHQNNTVRPCAPGQDKVQVKLKPGANVLLLKVTQGGGEWAACARLSGVDGKSLTKVIISPVSD